jgi:hypothetical protein
MSCSFQLLSKQTHPALNFNHSPHHPSRVYSVFPTRNASQTFVRLSIALVDHVSLARPCCPQSLGSQAVGNCDTAGLGRYNCKPQLSIRLWSLTGVVERKSLAHRVSAMHALKLANLGQTHSPQPNSSTGRCPQRSQPLRGSGAAQ